MKCSFSIYGSTSLPSTLLPSTLSLRTKCRDSERSRTVTVLSLSKDRAPPLAGQLQSEQGVTGKRRLC
jgi:hypothetical protein